MLTHKLTLVHHRRDDILWASKHLVKELVPSQFRRIGSLRARHGPRERECSPDASDGTEERRNLDALQAMVENTAERPGQLRAAERDRRKSAQAARSRSIAATRAANDPPPRSPPPPPSHHYLAQQSAKSNYAHSDMSDTQYDSTNSTTRARAVEMLDVEDDDQRQQRMRTCSCSCGGDFEVTYSFQVVSLCS